MKKVAILAGSAVLAMGSVTANAQIDQVNDSQLAEVDGQILLALTVAAVEAKKHDAILRVAQSLDLAREVHETAEDVARLTAVAGIATAGAAAAAGTAVAATAAVGTAVAATAAVGTAVVGTAVAGTVAAGYVATEIVIGEILGEILSIEEDVRIRLNLIDAFRPGNG